MTNSQHTRRAVLSGCGTLAAATLGTATATAKKEEQADEQSLSLSGIYRGTVDRIVGGEHVVILLEYGGRVVDQTVIDHDRVPAASEGDYAVVWLQDDEVRAIMLW